MSKEVSNVAQLEPNNDEDRYNEKLKSWNYPHQFDSYQKHNRTCCSPVDEVESVKIEEQINTHSVEVQTEKSALFMLKQEKKLENSCRKDNKNSEDCMRQNEFFNVKLRKTGINYDQHDTSKVTKTLSIDTQVLDEYVETDDQSMYALCYDEQNLEEEKKENNSKNEFLYVDDTVEEEKIEATKSKGTNGKESRNKKDMFSSSRSFKEIFNFFKDRDKKRSQDSSKSVSSEGSKILKSLENYEQKVDRSPQSTQSSSEQSDRESKMRNNYQGTQQTPLIFSRCSSLGSLTGFDDRSSIVSDFSHKTSGRLSPSEITDMPVQSTLSNIKLQQKSQIGCFGKKKTVTSQQDKSKTYQQSITPTEIFHQQIDNDHLKKLPFIKTSIFEDYVTSFKDESTPNKLHSVAASSLSSLTIDDDDDFEILKKSILNNEKPNSCKETELQNDRQEPIGESNHEDDDIAAVTQPEKTKSDIQKEDYSKEEDDQLMNLTRYEEELLDECIRRGIAKLTRQDINEIKPFSWDLGLTCLATKALLASRIRVHSVEILSKIIKEQQDAIIDNVKSNSKENSQKKYNPNHVNCNDQATIDDKSNNNQSTENSNYSTYEEQLLDQCIRRGIAKITKKNINEIRPFSWDTNQICLTTRAIILHGCSDEVYSSICAT